MKKIVSTIVCIISVICYALPVNAQQAFYIYRNDGVINTFITTEIDSMTYSCVGVDSVVHDEYVVNEVYTSDSIYRIPIAVIDSIGFITPKTIYQPDVIVLDGDIRNYIISRDDFTLRFLSTTPKSLLPQKGDKLVTTEIDNVITNAFVGKVTEVISLEDGIKIICEPVNLTDIFECYYGIIKKMDEPDSVRHRSIEDGFFGTDGTRTFNPGKKTHELFNSHDVSITYNKDEELSGSIDNARATISLTPIIDYNAFLIVNKTYGVNLSITAVGRYSLETSLELSGDIDYELDIPFIKKVIPIPEALIDFEFELGLFGEAKGSVIIDQIWTRNYKHFFHWEWSSKGHESLQKVHEFKNTSNTHTGEVALNGSLGLGFYGKIGIAFIATSDLDIAEMGLKYKGGLCYESTYVPYKRDVEYARKSTDLYNQIKDREIAAYKYRELTFEAKLFKWSVSKEIPNFFNIPFNKKDSEYVIRCVPLFSDTKLTKNDGGTFNASTKVSKKVNATDIGFALINNNNAEDATYLYSIYNYSGPKAEAHASFYDKPELNSYTVYPLVKYRGMELIAEPSAVVENESPVTMTLEMERIGYNHAIAKCKFTGLKDLNGICGIEYWANRETHKEQSVNIEDDGDYYFDMFELIPNTTYHCRAFIKVGDEYIRANSTTTFETAHNSNVRLTDFKQNTSYYFPKAFRERGGLEKDYDYKFFTQFKIESDVKDPIVSYGCMYKGPSGDYIEHYFCDEERLEDGIYYFTEMVSNLPEETLVIIPFVMIDKDDKGYEKVFGKKMNFSLKHNGNFFGCPDDNHPHAIDLGLRSGTKWACCNVGAKAPEQDGGHYMWGESVEKNFYDWRTYTYAIEWDKHVDIGSDIAGTKYDAATVLWGDPWKMPTEEQFSELLSDVRGYIYAPYNGVNGIYIIVPNGSSIFLPTAGTRFGYDKGGDWGYYWTSTLDVTNPVTAIAHYLPINSAPAFYSILRFEGLSIRAVQGK